MAVTGSARRLLLGALFLAGCAGTSDASDPYLRDASFRRATLVASLVNPGNAYSRLRLLSYDTGGAGDWSRLPEWNPKALPVSPPELDRLGEAVASAPLGPDARRITVDDAALRGDESALVALGEEAFFRYPVQLAIDAATATSSRATFARYGFWTDAARAGGLVRVELADGSRTLAYTCATCHAATQAGVLIIGVGNEQLDLGRLAVDASPNREPRLAARLVSWGPGRVDVTTNDGTEPVRIPDLRPVRWLTHLQADATVVQRDRATLAVRIETLIVTSHDELVRPPRAIALGLAAYVWSLASGLPRVPPPGESEARGETVFQATCARCHAPPALTGPPVPLALVGTDPTVGLSLDRGTGNYRVPSLHGVGTRGALLHDASLGGLTEMFDPTRLSDDYAGGRHGPGPVRGHPFGLDLAEADRSALVLYLATL